MDTYIKDPDAILDYKIDWSAWLAEGDIIVESTWTASSDAISINSSQRDDTFSVVWLSGGTVGESYTLTNHIKTTAGREDDRSIKIRIKEK